MIELRLQGTTLDIDTTTGISFNRQTPLFNDERIKGSRSEPINLLDTPHNNRTLKHLKYLRHANSAYIYKDAEIYFASGVLYRGALAVSGFNGDYEAIFTVSVVVIEAARRPLHTIFWGNPIHLGNTSQAVASYCQTDKPQLGLSFPLIHNEEFYDDDNWSAIINRKGAPSSLVNTTQTGNSNSFMPCFYLKFIFEKLAEQLNFTFKGDLFDAPWWPAILLHSRVPLDATDTFGERGEAHYLGITENEEVKNNRVTRLLGGDKYRNVTVYKGYQGTSINIFNPITFGNRTVTGNFNSQGRYVCPTSTTYRIKTKIFLHVPFLTPFTSGNYRITLEYQVSNVMVHASQTLMSLGPDVENPITFDTQHSFNQDDEIALRVIFEEADSSMAYQQRSAVVYRASCEIHITDPQPVNIYAKRLIYNRHLPDITVGELFKALHSTFNLSIVPDPLTRTIHFNLAENIINKPRMLDVTDQVHLPNTQNHNPITYPNMEGFRLKWDAAELSDDFIEVGAPPFQEQSLPAAPLKRGWAQGAFHNLAFDTAISTLNGDSDSTTFNEIRLLFHSPQYSTLQLQLSGSGNTLFNLMFRLSYQVKYFAPLVDITLLFSIEQIKSLDFGTLLFINYQAFLIKEAQHTLSHKIQPTKIKAWVVQ